MSADVALRVRLTVPGRPEQVATARTIVALALGADHPCTDAAVLITSELVTNSVIHSDSRHACGTVTITVAEIGHGLRIEVTDDGAPDFPALRLPGADDEAGRGLELVDALAARWE
ncbi:MAG TPA: ATP-binding protein, partial [Streptosporangiaceae bacterium]|nr:ATP-binding protein [Streptosporangiaceae bacterium]